MITIKPSKKLTEDVLSLFGDKYLLLGDKNLDNLFETSPYFSEYHTARKGERKFFSKLSNFLSEEELESLYNSAKLLYRSGDFYRQVFSDDLSDAEIRYDLVHPKDWALEIDISFEALKYGGFKFWDFISITQDPSDPSLSMVLTGFNGYSDYFSSITNTELISMVDNVKDILAFRVKDKLADRIRKDYFVFSDDSSEKVLSDRVEQGLGDESSYNWLRYRCPRSSDFDRDF